MATLVMPNEESSAAGATAAASSNGGYIKTTTHNYVSRQATIEGAKQVEIKGRSILQPGVQVRGDYAMVRIGRYCEIEQNSRLEPPPPPTTTTIPDTLNTASSSSSTNTSKKYVPMIIGSHTHIGKNCQIQAAAIGSMVWIGDSVTLRERVVIKDNCIIDDNVVIGADTVVPPFTRISAKNSLVWTELPPSMAVHMQDVSLERYQQFKKEERERQ